MPTMHRSVDVLPCAVGPDESYDLARLNCEREIVHRFQLAIDLRQMTDSDHCDDNIPWPKGVSIYRKR